MTSASESLLNPVKAKKVKLAVGAACELCGREYPLRSLEIHRIQGETYAPRTKDDLQHEILVLCPSCHHAIHAFSCPKEDQERLVGCRHAEIAEEIGRILAYRAKPYTPPEVDLEQVFFEATQIDMVYRVC
jgi:hypothetical protein